MQTTFSNEASSGSAARAVLSTNPTVRNALAARNAKDWTMTAAWAAGAALSEAQRRKNEEAKRRARGEVGHAVRDLRSMMPLLGGLARTGDSVNGVPADDAVQTVRFAVDALSRLFGV